jgi:hypothetical protein
MRLRGAPGRAERGERSEESGERREESGERRVERERGEREERGRLRGRKVHGGRLSSASGPPF